jgi:branched-chain amino acid transport system ATP-binding protein
MMTSPEPDDGPAAPPLLRVGGLRASYGDLKAVWDVSLTVTSGTITLMLGRNGAGKTTTLSAIAGLLKSSGTLELDGRDISSAPAHRRTRLGITLVQEGKRVFRQRTVEENLLIAGGVLPRSQRHPAIDNAYERFPMLRDKRRAPAGTLSGGQQQMLAIAQALIPGPRLIMMDEPSAGLAPAVMHEVFEVARSLAGEGIGVLLVEQVLEHALPFADWVVVLDRGVTAAEMDHDELQRNPAKLHQIYLGLDESLDTEVTAQ